MTPFLNLYWISSKIVLKIHSSTCWRTSLSARTSTTYWKTSKSKPNRPKCYSKNSPASFPDSSSRRHNKYQTISKYTSIYSIRGYYSFLSTNPIFSRNSFYQDHWQTSLIKSTYPSPIPSSCPISHTPLSPSSKYSRNIKIRMSSMKRPHVCSLSYSNPLSKVVWPWCSKSAATSTKISSRKKLPTPRG